MGMRRNLKQDREADEQCTETSCGRICRVELSITVPPACVINVIEQ